MAYPRNYFKRQAYHRIGKTPAGPEDLEEIDQLYAELKELLGDWFRFQVDYVELELD